MTATHEPLILDLVAWIAERRDESIELLAEAISANYDRAFPRSRPRADGRPRSA